MLNRNVAANAATEVLIVGGGPAGLAAAIALRQRGIDCTVVEARPASIDKACGEGLMPDSRETLARLGIALTASDGHPFRGIRFANSLHRVDACFPRGAGIGIRRPHLHALLTARAEQSGARILWNSRIQLPGAGSNSNLNAPHGTLRSALVNGQPLRFRWLIGADGQASSVRRWAGLDRARIRSLRFGFRTHYRVAPWSEFVEVHWAPGGQLYITPVAPDCVCIVYITRDPRRISAGARVNILADFPEVAARLAGAELASHQRAAVTASCKLRRVANSFVALLGDASGSADAITGEGLAISFRQALALADSIHSGSLEPYRRAHLHIGKLPLAMGELMLTLDRWPALQVRAIQALAATPIFFEDLLHAHMGEKNLASVLLRRAPRFGWSLLTKGAPA
ncbi:MAG: FAD-dependent monooxygenase [Acidobacteriaceae bacterium]|jgi:2-polyprenyl-6-methoxyphenol hydroxylase-like FAD-dependent oxidoreductase